MGSPRPGRCLTPAGHWDLTRAGRLAGREPEGSTAPSPTQNRHNAGVELHHTHHRSRLLCAPFLRIGRESCWDAGDRATLLRPAQSADGAQRAVGVAGTHCSLAARAHPSTGALIAADVRDAGARRGALGRGDAGAGGLPARPAAGAAGATGPAVERIRHDATAGSIAAPLTRGHVADRAARPTVAGIVDDGDAGPAIAPRTGVAAGLDFHGAAPRILTGAAPGRPTQAGGRARSWT